MLPLGASRYTVKRTSPGEYVNGSWVAGNVSTRVIVASIQPFSGKDMLSMPEGMRARKPIKVFTKAVLHTADVVTDCDIVVYEGLEYEVQTSQWHNTNAPISHGCYIAYASEVK